MWLHSLGMMFYLIAPIIGTLIYISMGKPLYNIGDKNYTFAKWLSFIGLYFVALLVWFGYFQTENYIGIVELFEKLQKGYGHFSLNDHIFFLITFLVAIIFPIPTFLALITAFIAHSSIDFGVISFVFFATFQYIFYLKKDSYFYMEDILEWIKVLSPLMVSIIKIFF